jgi:nucleoside-diphosphate-sugar epimerase
MLKFNNLNPSLKIAVTGGSGFLGKEIISMLLKAGCDNIISIARKPQNNFQGTKVQKISADISDYNSFAEYFKGADIVFHTAAKAAVWGKYSEFYTVNTRGTDNVINACLNNNVPILIYTSSPSVVSSGHDLKNITEQTPYPEKFYSYYAETKCLAEKNVLKKRENLKTVSLRPHLIWGPGDPHILPRIIQKARKGKLAVVGDGNNIVDLTYITNAAFAHLLAADKLLEETGLSGKAYFITDDNPVNLWQWINNFLAETGLKKIDKKISAGKAYTAGKIFELLYSLFCINSEPPITAFSALQLSHSHYFDISAAKKDLGYHIIAAPDEALKNTVQFFKTQPV